MKILYWKFIDWMSTLSMEEVFIFTGVSVLVIGFAIGLPLGLYFERNTTPRNDSKS